MKEIYLDNAATTKAYPEVAAEIKDALLNNYANPSSPHTKGLAAERAIKEARELLADHLAVKADEIYFTSGGTEANNLAIKGSAKALKSYGSEIITTRLAHPSLLKSCQSLSEDGFKIKYVATDNQGRVDLDSLNQLLSNETILVSLLAVNNELGTIQPLDEIANLLADYKDTYLHFDGVQALGKLKQIDLTKIDLLSLSAHKIHGPKGIGALYVAEDIRVENILSGSQQERGLRPGTENLPGIVGFKVALELIDRIKIKRLYKLKRSLYQNLIKKLDNIKLNGPTIEAGAAHILNLSFKDIKGEVLVNALSRDGIYISTSAACSSKKDLSHVISNLAETDYEAGTVRISFSGQNSKDDILYAVDKIVEQVKTLRKFS